jgi:hypothetical protein
MLEMEKQAKASENLNFEPPSISFLSSLPLSLLLLILE